MKIIQIENFKNKTKNILRNGTKDVEFPLSAANKKLIADMKEKLYKLGGVGLAAPQVNSNKNLALIYIPEDAAKIRDNAKPYPMHTIINPSYEGLDKSKIAKDFEGCYSVKSKAGDVPRFEKIKLKYYDEDGKLYESIESGFYARVLQHEIDHLNGVLIIDRFTDDCLHGSIDEMIELRKQNLSPEKKKALEELIRKKNSKTNSD